MSTECWYVPDRRIMNQSACRKAVSIAEWLTSGTTVGGLDREPADHELFCALHTCAYQASRCTMPHPRMAAENAPWYRCHQLIREYITQKHQRLVYAMIGKVGHLELDEEDLLSEGMYALTQAVDRFNPWKGFCFSTYACNVIVRAFLRRAKREHRYRRLFPVQVDTLCEWSKSDDGFKTQLYVERVRRALDRNLGAMTDLELKVLAYRFPEDDGCRA